MGGRFTKPRPTSARVSGTGRHAGVTVEDKYTRPTGLYVHKSIDFSRLRKLILAGRLAPCFAGLEECAEGTMEECPICMLFYPALNRSKCCNKSLCTECFLQVKSPTSPVVSCPFCKMVGYAVVFRGAKSPEELQRELLEDQRVIEARMRAINGDAALSSPTATAPVDVPGQTPGAAAALRDSSTSDASSPPPSTPLSALPMLSPGSERLSSPTTQAHADDDARLAAFLRASPSQAMGVPQQGQRAVGRTGSGRRVVLNARLRDHYPPELLAAMMREGGTVSVSALDDALLMQAIWASLQEVQPGGDAPPATSSPRGAGGANGSSTSEAGSEGDDSGDETSSGGVSTEAEEEAGASSRSLPHELHPSVSYDNLTRRASMGAQSWDVDAMGGPGNARLTPLVRVNSTVFEEREPTMNAPSQPDDDVATPPAGSAPPAAWAVQNNAAFEAGPAAADLGGEEAHHAVDLAPHATEAAPAGAAAGEEPDNAAVG